MSIKDLRRSFIDLDFPEYQREPNIWSREQKQRLVDSILRRFDIASVYFYCKDDGTVECIDGRQRLNAIMSFLGMNLADDRDNGFELRLENEISSGLATDYDELDGLSFEQINGHAKNEKSSLHGLAKKARKAVLEYSIATVKLSGTMDVEEFNLQFLRLNLGTLINAGEKLHAMVGAMRDVVFAEDGVGKHPFFDSVRIPTRRYAKELTAAQVLLQLFSIDKAEEFARARHVELQRFLKEHENLDAEAHSLIDQARDTLNAMNRGIDGAEGYLRNRAVTVSLILLAWQRDVAGGELLPKEFWAFTSTFMGRLNSQVKRMKAFKEVDSEYQHFVEFQRHLTQASVEKPAVTRRHEILCRSLDRWLDDETVEGDREHRERIGQTPEQS